MTMRLRHWGLTALLAVVVPRAAVAEGPQPLRPIYFSATGMHVSDAGSDLANAGTVDINGAPVRYAGDGEFTNGIGGLLAIGYGGRAGPRGELEVGYRKVDALFAAVGADAGGGGLAAGEGDMKTLTLMANGIYALDQGSIQSYIGAGVGIARHKFTYGDMAIAADGEVVAGNTGVSDEDTVFAYQAMAGVEFPVTERVDGRLGYRYFRTADADIEGDDIGYAMHNFEAGLIMRF